MTVKTTSCHIARLRGASALGMSLMALFSTGFISESFARSPFDQKKRSPYDESADKSQTPAKPVPRNGNEIPKPTPTNAPAPAPVPSRPGTQNSPLPPTPTQRPSPDFRPVPNPNLGPSSGPNPGPTPTPNAVPGPALTQPADLSNTRRSLVSKSDHIKEPYWYIGRITASNNPKDPSRGTGTLIGPRHVLTAAHVVLGALAKSKERAEKTGGEPSSLYFTISDGKGGEVSSRILASELDGGYKYRLSAFDIGLCLLEDDLGASGHAQWSVFDDTLFNSTVEMAGYDVDISGFALPLPLTTRSGTVRTNDNYEKIGTLVGFVGGGFVGELVTPSSRKGTEIKIGAATPILGAAGAAYGWLFGKEFGSYGWKADFPCVPGGSGGPIWIYRNGDPFIVGVQSVVFAPLNQLGFGVQIPESDKALPIGSASGSRITKGACERMIRHFLQTR